jgi:hypothetical protein
MPIPSIRKCARALSGWALVLSAFLALPVYGQTSPAAAQTATTDKGGSEQDSAAEQVRLHVYRQRRYEGSALAPSIYVDDKQVVRVGNGRRATIRLTPGAHTVRSDDKSSAISLDAKAGQDYYVRIDEATGFWKGHGRLTLVLPEQGSAEYKLQKPIEENRIVNKEMVIPDSPDAAPKSESK